MGRAALVTLLLLGLVETAASSPRAQPVQEGQPSKQYRFTYDWFTQHIPVWREVLAPYQGRPNVHYLEVGVFEGRSAIWMLENVLTHPSSTLTGIDIFPGDHMNWYLANLQFSGHADKATTIKGRSQIELRRLQPDSYNIIYIDGGHSADMVLADAVLSWDLLKTGGVLIFDDYGWPRKYPDELKPAVAIDAFITAYRNYLDVLHYSYQVILRKQQGPPLVGRSRTVLGEYVYAWDGAELRRRSDDRQVELSDAERHALETLIRSRPFGETAFVVVVGPHRALDPNLRVLRDRLGIEFEVRASTARTPSPGARPRRSRRRVRLPGPVGRVLNMEAISWLLAGLLVGVGVTLVAVRPRRGVATK